MKIGNLMTEILREQSFTFKYVMDHSEGNLEKLEHAQVGVVTLPCQRVKRRPREELRNPLVTNS